MGAQDCRLPLDGKVGPEGWGITRKKQGTPGPSYSYSSCQVRLFWGGLLSWGNGAALGWDTEGKQGSCGPHLGCSEHAEQTLMEEVAPLVLPSLWKIQMVVNHDRGPHVGHKVNRISRSLSHCGCCRGQRWPGLGVASCLPYSTGAQGLLEALNTPLPSPAPLLF